MYAKENQGVEKLTFESWFTWSPGKGSHTKWFHPLLPGKLTLSGKDGDDAKRYQEQDVNNALQKLKEIQQEEDEE